MNLSKSETKKSPFENEAQQLKVNFPAYTFRVGIFHAFVSVASLISNVNAQIVLHEIVAMRTENQFFFVIDQTSKNLKILL